MSKYFNSKAGGLEDVAANMTNYATENGYQDLFKKELEKTGVGIGSMSPKEKSAFFNKIDTMYKAKDEAIDKDGAYAIGMAQAMKAKDDQPPLKKSTITKAHDIAKSIEKDQKEEVSQKEIDKFHTSLDKLVHKSFGHSSDEKKKEIKEAIQLTESHFKVGEKVECIASGMKGEVIEVDPKEEGKYYTVKREDGTTMKYAPNELKSLQKENADPAGDEMNLKKLLSTGQRKTWAQLKKETTALEGYMTRMKQEEESAKKKKQTDTEEKITPVEMNPKVDYRF